MMKIVSFTLLTLIIITLVIATILEKVFGTGFVVSNIYGSWWFVALWAIQCVTAGIYLVQRKAYRRPATLLLHASFFLILAGALFTHLYGLQGSLYLRMGEPTDKMMNRETELIESLPFTAELVHFDLKTYPGTQSPMDYESTIKIQDDEADTHVTISMNNIGHYKSYRLYQSGYDPDMQGTYLSVSHDPWGIGLSYTGYALLFLSMLLMLILPNEGYRRLIRSSRAKTTFALLLMLSPWFSLQGMAAEAPSVLPKEVAAEFGNLYAYYNGRVCPLQTVATDFTTKLYGKPNYQGLTAEQVMTGLMLFPTTWLDQPLIKIKGERVRELLNSEENYVSYGDFFSRGTYMLEEVLADIHAGKKLPDARNITEADEKMNLLLMLFNGQLVKIYPYNVQDSIKKKSSVIWYSQADNLPEEMPHDQWFFTKHAMDYIGELATKGDYAELTATVNKIREFQQKTATTAQLPTPLAFKAEKLYNRFNYVKLLAIFLVTIGIIAFIFSIICKARNRQVYRCFHLMLLGICIATLIYLLSFISLRTIVSGHLPLANGFEVMLFMSLCSLVFSLCMWRKSMTIHHGGIVMAGLTMLVAMMGQSNPQITPLMPVLASPLLSIHVCIVMTSYTLFAFIALNSIAALIAGEARQQTSTSLPFQSIRTSLMMLYPAVFLLTAGIFIGAIWANISWGRYWGWDPKEVWALITMLLYSLPLHHASIRWFQKPKHFHWFMVLAFLSVIITYFGVNFFLGGMHSYANS